MPEDRTNKVSCSSYTHELEVAFEILSGKWVPLIMWTLAGADTRRFGELRRLMPKITQKMLTQQLRNLERYDIIHREEHPGIPPAVEYSLTEMGRRLIPFFEGLNAWSIEYLEKRQS